MYDVYVFDIELEFCICLLRYCCGGLLVFIFFGDGCLMRFSYIIFVFVVVLFILIKFSYEKYVIRRLYGVKVF